MDSNWSRIIYFLLGVLLFLVGVSGGFLSVFWFFALVATDLQMVDYFPVMTMFVFVIAILFMLAGMRLISKARNS